MCAIFGLALLKGHKLNNNDKTIRTFIRNLFIENMARGRDASGIAYLSSGEITVIKKNLAGSKFINLDDYNRVEEEYMAITEDRSDIKISKYQPLAAICHCRFKTQGTESNNVNNHPIIRQNVVGVHNGIISNDSILFSRFSSRFKRNGEVDSEIIFALIDYFSDNEKGNRFAIPISEAIKQASSLLSGSYACVMTHRKAPHKIWFFRNSNPCDIVLFREIGLLAWSSSYRYIQDSIRGLKGIGPMEKVEFGFNSGITIDLYSNKLYRFKLDINNYENKYRALGL